ncbi:MAG: tetratricopeptide (TPR) repeat protein [Gammaproteobacteria bacterium]|jgi:tetratricopeptide (TPR) repeat protein
MSERSTQSTLKAKPQAGHLDPRGVPISACDPSSLADFETALIQFESFFGDPTETLQVTLERDPEFVLGHIFCANAMLLMTERQYLPAIRESLDKANKLSAKSNSREKSLIAAAQAMLDGHWVRASTIWDQVLAEYPRDALALQSAHLLDFYLGDAVNLRDRISRVMGHWDKGLPNYSYILGMQAFGLEECNEFGLAEDTALAALDIERRDPWCLHALTHVFEMQNRYREGQTLLTSRVDDWAPDNGFAFHNWWHLGLFYLEREDYASALELYDEKIAPQESDISLEILDASALLWRLQLQGQNVGPRWSAVVDAWSKKTAIENGYYAFNDLHAVMALVGSGRIESAREVLAAVQDAAQSNVGVTRRMAADIGIPTCSAFIAFGEERYDDAIDALYPIRSIAHRFGGSHAQRDVLTQTLLEAAIRAGRCGLVENLINERKVHKPSSPLTQRFQHKLQATRLD